MYSLYGVYGNRWTKSVYFYTQIPELDFLSRKMLQRKSTRTLTELLWVLLEFTPKLLLETGETEIAE